MSTIPAVGYVSNAARTEGEVKQALEDTNASLRQVPGAGQTELAITISGDSITPAGVGGVLVLDTEASAATDNLNTIITTNYPDGSIVLIRNANAARFVVVKSLAGGAGQINLDRGADYTLDDTKKWLLLQRRGTDWYEVLRGPHRLTVPMLAKTATYTVAKEDIGKLINCTGTFTVNLLAAASAGNGFTIAIRNAGTGTITVDPNSAELVEGQSTLTLTPGQAATLTTDASAWTAIVQPNIGMPRLYISGLTYANNGTDPTNDIDILAGECRDSTNVHTIALAALTKRLDAAWAVGTNQGGLDTGSIVNGDYHIWAIKRFDTGVGDALLSLSSTAPTMPPGYTGSSGAKRLIGWFKRVGGTIVAFQTYETAGGGVDFQWKTPTLDINLANTLTTTARLDTVKVPTNFSVLADLYAAIDDVSTPAVTITSPDMTDLAVGSGGYTFRMPSANITGDMNCLVMTSSSGQIRAKSNIATVDLYNVYTNGFIWARRN